MIGKRDVLVYFLVILTSFWRHIVIFCFAWVVLAFSRWSEERRGYFEYSHDLYDMRRSEKIKRVSRFGEKLGFVNTKGGSLIFPKVVAARHPPLSYFKKTRAPSAINIRGAHGPLTSGQAPTLTAIAGKHARPKTDGRKRDAKSSAECVSEYRKCPGALPRLGKLHNS